ncbi:VOC family protein [Comamonas sp. Y33R10-2]|uniref:VOC family protein n=1 Tax=Comamonas sp. Y33R10-2 TaxID=2853257 RepID=UPI001C5C8AFC|nr:VOC family protein [Comamonas sp. Y33R10-2]QXZ10563.1 VOC family protein [Comamonas sp. Y33R10-2]
MALLPKGHFRHIGIFAFEPSTLIQFYSRWFGLVVSDHGIGSTGHEVAFMTADPEEHHQLAIANGRKPEWPGMNQISFVYEDLETLKGLAEDFHKEGVKILQQKDHGNTWSIYVEDPEGNRIECYTPTPWYVSQPIWWPLDLVNEDVQTIRARTEQSAKVSKGFKMRSEWQAEIQARIDAQRQLP